MPIKMFPGLTSSLNTTNVDVFNPIFSFLDVCLGWPVFVLEMKKTFEFCSCMCFGLCKTNDYEPVKDDYADVEHFRVEVDVEHEDEKEDDYGDGE